MSTGAGVGVGSSAVLHHATLGSGASGGSGHGAAAAAAHRGACAPPPLRIDTHTHIMPQELPDLRERYGYPGWVRLGGFSACGKRAVMLKDDGTSFRAVEDSLWSIPRRLADCAGVGVDVHVLSTVPVMFNYWARGEDTCDLAVRLNDHVAAACAQAPEHLVGLGTLPLQCPELALGELKRCKALGLAGVQIGTHVSHQVEGWGCGGKEWRHWPLSAPELFPVFAAAEALDMAVFVHPWDMMGGELMRDYFLPWLVGMPAETTMAMCSLMFAGVLERLPRLRVCFAHGGGAFAATLGRIQHGWDVRPDLCAKDTAWSPQEHLDRRRMWVDSLVHEPQALSEIVRVYGEDRVCLGSDYPFPLGEYTAESGGKEYSAGALVDSMAAAGRPGWEIGGSTRAAVLGGAALQWLDRDESAFRRMRG